MHHHVDWMQIQKAVQAAIIFAWEGWLGQTDKIKASSTYELVKFGFKWFINKFKKENKNV